MGLFTYSKIEHDFPGGLYLPKLAAPIPHEINRPDKFSSLLSLPLRIGDSPVMQTVVTTNQIVKAGQLLAQSPQGHYLYCPADGQIKGIDQAFVEHRPDQPVLQLQCDSETITGGLSPEFSLASYSDKEHHKQLLNAIDRSGIINPSDAKPLASIMRNLADSNIIQVASNATGLEPGLTSALAILNQFPEQVFAGQSIIRRWLGASQAVMAYPYHFQCDSEAAEIWQVSCVPVSEKYPQGRDSSVLKSLQTGGFIKKNIGNVAVFDIQMLRQLERLILTGQLPFDRIVTVCGNGIKNPAHYQVPIGTSVMDLLHHAGIDDNIACVAAQSTLAGYAIDPETAVVNSRSQAFIAIKCQPNRYVGNCIRCGRCIESCPAKIDPIKLYSLAENEKFDKAQKLGAAKCIECGICSYICPASLPIMERIRLVKRKKNITEGRWF